MSLFSLIDQALQRQEPAIIPEATAAGHEIEAPGPAEWPPAASSFPNHRPADTRPPARPADDPPAAIDQQATKRGPGRRGRREAGEELQHFRAGWAWIMDHLPELQAAGWTRPALFRRSPFSWPCGPWGAAWIPAWTAPGLHVRINDRGEIVFTFPSSGRLITQRIKPRPW